MKKLINDPDKVVAEALEGMERAYGGRVKVNHDPAYIVSREAPKSGRVGVLSGGGSGHEPMHGGFVGPGMLDAAVPGQVFTSPTPDQVEAATKAIDGGSGVLHLVKNYTGDVANFEMAAELCEAEGIRVKSVVIDDDVAVKDSLFTAGRRGVGGTVLIEKIIGACTDRGDDLDTAAALAADLNSRVRSMGMALTPCTVPHAGEPTFELADNEMEIGIGIHGEPGRERMPLESADAIAKRLLDPILEDMPIAKGEDVLVMVNGMGGTPLIELFIIYRRICDLLAERGVHIRRNLVGNYITALEMAGCSVTVMKLDDDTTHLWDAPVDTPGMSWGSWEKPAVPWVSTWGISTHRRNLPWVHAGEE